MKLVLLGSTGYHPNDQRHTACVMLPEIGVVLDAGTGFYRVRERLCTPALDLFLTHAHLDHVVGLSFLFDVVYGRETRVRVHGSAETLAAVRDHLLAPPLFPVALPCEYAPLVEPVALAGGGRLRWFPLAHPGGSLGFRLDWPDRSLAYVTDTTAAADAPYASEIAGVDLLLHECYFSDEQAEFAARTGHSCTTPVAELARRCKVGTLVLMHANPLPNCLDPIGLPTARRIFPATLLGTDLLEIEF